MVSGDDSPNPTDTIDQSYIFNRLPYGAIMNSLKTTSRVLPTRKQNKTSMTKVLKSVKNKHPRLPVDYKVKKKGNRKTGLVR